MPYGIRKSGDKYKVVNKETGRVFGTHPSKEKAKKQLAALYVHANPKRESIELIVRVLNDGKHIIRTLGPSDLIQEAVKKEILQKAAVKLDINPEVLMDFIKQVDTEQELPHGNWICMAAAKGMPLNERTREQLKMMLSFFVRYKKQVVESGNSGNIFDYPDYETFRQMIFSFSKNAYDFDPTALSGVTKVLDSGPYTLYKIQASKDNAEEDARSLALMGNGTKWCTRAEYSGEYNGNAKGYLYTNNPSRTMYIITKFNAPYAQMQKDLSALMDVNDRDALYENSSLSGTFELADVFMKAASEFTVTTDAAKRRFLAMVGVRSRKSLEYFLAQGYDKGMVAKMLAKPLSSMGFSDEEIAEFYGPIVMSNSVLELSQRYNPDINKFLMSADLTNAKIRERVINFTIYYATNVIRAVRNEKVDASRVLPLESVLDKMSDTSKGGTDDDESLNKVLLSWCIFVRQNKWPEKEKYMLDSLRSPELLMLYNQLGEDSQDEALESNSDLENDPDMDKLIKKLKALFNHSRLMNHNAPAKLDAVETANMRDLVGLYGRLPKLEELFKKYPIVGSNYKNYYERSLSTLSVEEVP